MSFRDHASPTLESAESSQRRCTRSDRALVAGDHARLDEREWLGFRLSSSKFPIWVFDRSTGTVIAANDAALLAYGCTREEILVSTVCDILRPAAPDGMRLLRAPHDGVLWTGPWLQRRKDGSSFWAEVGMIDAGDLDREATMVIVSAL